MFQNTISRGPKRTRDRNKTRDQAYGAQPKPDTKVTTAAAMMVLWLCISLIELLDAIPKGANDHMSEPSSAD